ncbi:MFS transporter [Georgenia sp. MJ170]|uniref:MFS transporter n=1 Tax=Georgenia sunbinii TaxID=3117728 RepID=UPI002F26D093
MTWVPRRGPGSGSAAATRSAGVPPDRHAGRRVVLAVVVVLLLGACLRAPITSVGPLLGLIGEDTGLGNGLLGLLGAMPLLGFALVSPLIHAPAARIGPERVVAAALLVLTAGIVLRSAPVPAGLWIGTALVGCGIAVGNVLAPAIIKRDQPGRIALVTACFTATMGSFAALASGLSVPLSDATGGGWRIPLGAWAVPVALVATVWVVRSRGTRGLADVPVAAPVAGGGRAATRSVWRSAGAWQVTVFMGVQSATFYIMANWLPSVLIAAGTAPATAGWTLFLYHLVGIPSGLAVTRLMRRRTDLRAVAVGISALIVVGATGIALVPALSGLWVPLVAMGSGSSLVVALSLFGLRTRTAAETAQLSGMAQSIGYLIAAAGPVLAGSVRDWTGSWTPVLGLIVAFAVSQAVIGLWAARPGYVQRG